MDRPERDHGRRLRLAGGVVTTTAGAAALLAIWFLPPTPPVEDRIAGWVGAFAALVAVLHGVLLLVGWSNGRRSLRRGGHGDHDRCHGFDVGALIAVQLFRLRRIRKPAHQ